MTARHLALLAALALLAFLTPLASACQPGPVRAVDVVVRRGEEEVVRHQTGLSYNQDSCTRPYPHAVDFTGRFVIWPEWRSTQILDLELDRTWTFQLGTYGRGVILTVEPNRLERQSLPQQPMPGGGPRVVEPPRGSNWLDTAGGYAWAVSGQGGVWVYDGGTDTFVGGAAVALPPPPADARIHAADGRFILAGNLSSEVWIHDRTTGRWTGHQLPEPQQTTYGRWSRFFLLDGLPTLDRGDRTLGGSMLPYASLEVASGDWVIRDYPRQTVVGDLVASFEAGDIKQNPRPAPAGLATTVLALAAAGAAIARRRTSA